jgi:hypothetical protein
LLLNLEPAHRAKNIFLAEFFLSNEYRKMSL